MPSNKYDRLPQAGDTEKQSDTDFFYLAPNPLPIGVAVLSSKHVCRPITEECMDVATGTATLEYGARSGIGIITCMIIFFFLIGLGMGISEHLRYGDPVLEITKEFILPNGYLWAFIALLASMYIHSFSRAVRKLTRSSPIRFNRQRREVAYVAKRGQPPRFVPWEEVIACVTSGKVITQYGTHNSFSLMIGLRSSASGDVVWITLPAGSLMLAVSEWEAIRAYMEEGPNALPKPLSEEHEEGTVAYFQFCRQAYRDTYSYPRYLFGFLMIQFCSGWTLPCHIAAWVRRLPKTSFPKSVLEWSRPIAPEKWQKPSDELIEQSKAVRKSLQAGLSFFDHFQGGETPEASRPNPK